jgi:uncharacterized protein
MSVIENQRPPLPLFDAGTATQKVRMAEDAWNTRNPEKVSPKAKNIVIFAIF